METKRAFQSRAPDGACVPSSEAVGPTILIAEDDAGFRTLLGSALRRDGYRVIEVDSGIPMLHRLQQAIDGGVKAPALVIADERMPGMRGLEAFKRARAKGWSGPLVLITAFGNDESLFEASRVGATLIRKPFDVDDLRTVARFLMARPAKGSRSRTCSLCGSSARVRWMGDSLALALCVRCRRVRGFRW